MQKVLIVDDEVKVCQLIQGLIAWDELGFRIVGIAHDGLSALQIAQKEMPDLLITDIRMPGLDGLQLIERAKEMNPSLQCIIISGYRHFDYAHNAIKFGVQDYLLKPLQKDELIRTLKRLLDSKEKVSSARSDRQGALFALYEDSMAGRITAFSLTPDALLTRYQLTLPGTGRYCALLIKADLEDAPPEDPIWRIATEKLADGCESTLSELAERLHTATLPYCVVALLQVTQRQEAKLLSALHTLRDRMEMMRDLFPSLRVSIGYSGEAQPLGNLEALFPRALRALDLRLVHAEGAVFTAPLVPAQPYALHDLLGTDRLRQVSKAIAAMQIEAYRALLYECLDLLRIAVGGDLPALFLLMREWVRFHFAELPLNTPLQEMEDMMAASADSWQTAVSLAQVESRFAGLLISHLTRTQDALREVELLPLRKAKAYIREHYREPLTLERVSDIAGFNPAYFSTLFKKETGERFLEYLSSVRIKAAKQLLTESELPLSAIAEETGYGDTKYFCKQFKKGTGLSPQEYRKLYS